MEIFAVNSKKFDIIKQNGNKYFVLSVLHANPKKQEKFVELNVKNILTLQEETLTFLNNDIITLEKSCAISLKFLQEKNNLLYFLSIKTLKSYIAQKPKALISNLLIKDCFVTAFIYNDNIFHFLPKKFVKMKVCDIVFVKNNAYAVTETGLKVKLNKEIKIGDYITIDTTKQNMFA